MLLLYMNITGIRFAITPSAGSASWAVDLGITGPLLPGSYINKTFFVMSKGPKLDNVNYSGSVENTKWFEFEG
jgi:hypothetical protein